MQTKKSTLLIVAGAVGAVLLILGALAAVGFRAMQANTRKVETQNCVLAISGTAVQRFQPARPPSLADVDQVIRSLMHAGVIRSALDADGKPVDPYGTGYRVAVQTPGRRLIVTVTSAGPDGRFDTPDDVSNAAETE